VLPAVRRAHLERIGAVHSGPNDRCILAASRQWKRPGRAKRIAEHRTATPILVGVDLRRTAEDRETRIFQRIRHPKPVRPGPMARVSTVSAPASWKPTTSVWFAATVVRIEPFVI